MWKSLKSLKNLRAAFMLLQLRGLAPFYKKIMLFSFKIAILCPKEMSPIGHFSVNNQRCLLVRFFIRYLFWFLREKVALFTVRAFSFRFFYELPYYSFLNLIYLGLQI